MDIRQKAVDFMLKYGQHPDYIDLPKQTAYIVEQMKLGLAGQPSDLMMIPTYLSTEGKVKNGESVIVIDAGGTNFRICVATLTEEGVKVDHFFKRKMFGVGTPIDKDQFIEELAKLIFPLLPYANRVGFCFSYAAEITPDKDGKVISLSKEVYINGIEGTLLCHEIEDKLSEMGQKEDIKFILLNDTVATLLGGPAIKEDEKFDTQIGFILGTGTNIAYDEMGCNITKIKCNPKKKMIINTESAGLVPMKIGELDKQLDRESANPGLHLYEKAISGGYLGTLLKQTLIKAAADGLFSEGNKMAELPDFDLATVDSFQRRPFGDNHLTKACGNEDDIELVYHFIDLILDRSSKLVTASLAAILIETDGGKKLSQPARVMVEGTSFFKTYSYRERIESYMREYVHKQLGRYYMFTSGEDVNQIGSAIAAILNAK